MGKMRVGSSGAGVAVSQPNATVEQSEVVTVTTERVVERVVEIPKPVTKEVVVEIPKPVYKIVEVEQVVQKPKIKVEEVQQSVIKPVFTIKQETIILDQLQKKLEESVSIATNKLQVLNVQAIEQTAGNEELRSEVKQLKSELVVLKLGIIASVIVGAIAAVASVLG